LNKIKSRSMHTNRSCNLQFLQIPALIILLCILPVSLLVLNSCSADPHSGRLARDFLDPPESAKPWVFWYWMNACVSKEGITADLEAMKRAGIGGAYLMPIRGAEDPPQFTPPAVQLSPLWWDMVGHAFREADRLGLKLGMHACDGFAVAGGPWITPELSMQKVVWSDTIVGGGKRLDMDLSRPGAFEGYYRDIAVFSFPRAEGSDDDSYRVKPKVSSSIPGMDPGFLSREHNRENFRSNDSCWIMYSFSKPFTCRNITIHTTGYNYAAHRLWVQSSDDGVRFRTVCRLEPPRHGWQEEATSVVHAIVPVTARHFRFIYGRTGLEPGSEDLEMAKWTPGLKIAGIRLSGAPRIHQYLGKSGAIWRISPPTTTGQLPDSLCVAGDKLLNISSFMDTTGHLVWDAPEGRWTILRMGHTSTGKTNYTGGGGLGLECDKFNPAAARLQYENWFGAAVEKVGPELAGRVLEIFHVDSWECGSQNWSPVFRDEFIARRGYDPVDMLPAMAGIPLVSAGRTEKYLHDIRLTIAELVVDNFYRVLETQVHEQGCLFSAECTAPTMTGDGMLHYGSVDIPMGEFWLWSPTHDKPNDMLDAISGAHIYGKTLTQAEAFTELRLTWGEHPGMLRAIGDRNYTLGINRFVFHVFTHNPWIDRRPGMTLSRIGLYFQRDQTWWEPGRVWVEYSTRCQSLLQKGVPVADIAVFTGEEIPGRAVLPDRLVPALPGIFGKEVVEAEKERLANAGVPQEEMSEGVSHSANMADPGDWTDPLKGYAYDSFNPDALLNIASVRNGRIILPGGCSYCLLIIPGARRMDPGGSMLSDEAAARILELAGQGATILVADTLLAKTLLAKTLLADAPKKSTNKPVAVGNVRTSSDLNSGNVYRAGKGKIFTGPWELPSFEEAGLERDLVALDESGERTARIAWTHRRDGNTDIWFISNQEDLKRNITVSLKGSGRWPDLYDPLSGEIMAARTWKSTHGRTDIPLELEPQASIFIVLERKTIKRGAECGTNLPDPVHLSDLEGIWEVFFDPSLGGPDTIVRMKELESWHLSPCPGISHYSGTALYRLRFQWAVPEEGGSRYWLAIPGVHDMADVALNGKACGVIWTAPFRVEIGDFLVPGENLLEIRVSNTWANRLIGDRDLPAEERISWTAVPFNMHGRSLLEGGLTGRVSIYRQ
jgi:hypothetical protein